MTEELAKCLLFVTSIDLAIMLIEDMLRGRHEVVGTLTVLIDFLL